MNTKSLQCLAYPLSAPSFRKLVSAGSMAFDIVNDCDSGPTNCSLSYDSKAKPSFGAFKRVFLGRTSDLTLVGSIQICLKQCFYRNPLTEKKHLYDSSLQTSKLVGELNCIRWANGLLDLVYDFVKSASRRHGLPTFPIPQMRFVKAALAISQDQHREVYMIEEAINETFTKYIGNGNSRPLLQENPELEEIGEFLAFAQHVQYEKSGRMAFVADFQGECIT